MSLPMVSSGKDDSRWLTLQISKPEETLVSEEAEWGERLFKRKRILNREFQGIKFLLVLYYKQQYYKNCNKPPRHLTLCRVDFVDFI